MNMPTSRAGTSNRPFRGGGFTLIELVMVMAIISVIAAVVLPRLDPFVPQRRLKSAARLLSGTISLAYGEAISKNKTYRLYLDPSADEYWITEVEEITEAEDKGGAIGIRLGTQFELLQYVEGGASTKEEAVPSEPMFAPKKLPPGVHFLSVDLADEMAGTSLGPPFIEFSPLGAGTPVTVYLANDDGEQFAVRYDGVTGIPTLRPLTSRTG